MKKVIVSGATGQDGSYMIEYLLKNTDNTVIAAVRRTSQAILSNLSGVIDNPRVKLVTLDLCDGIAVTRLIQEEKPDYFINLGAQTFVKDSWANPVAHLQTNAISLVYILEAIREHAPHCRVYSAGSSEQWGDVLYSPQDEKHPNRPRSVYGVSKCAAAYLCKVYRESYGLYIVHGILLNHESERRQEYFVTRKITKGVARIAKAIQDGKSFEPIELGNLNSERDFSHAEDFMDGIWRMLNQEEHNHSLYLKVSQDRAGVETFFPERLPKYIQEYVLSSGETHTVREFVEKAFAAAGFSGTWQGSRTDERYHLITNGEVKNVSRYKWAILVGINPAFYRPADVETLTGNSTRARSELGWSPRISFDELVRRMVEHDLKEAGVVK